MLQRRHRPTSTAGFVVTIIFALQLAFPAAHLPGAGSSSKKITGETGYAGRAMYRQRVFHRFTLHALHRVCSRHIYDNTVFQVTGCPVQRLQWKASRGILGHRWNCFEHQLRLAVRYGLR